MTDFYFLSNPRFFNSFKSGEISSNFILNQLPYFSIFLIQSLVQKTSFTLARNWSSNFKNLAIRSLESNLQTQVKPSHSRILCFHIKYSNMNILSSWYRNQAIRKPKFIYASKTTTLMKDSKCDKIILKNRNWQQSGWQKEVSWSDSEIDNVEHPNMTESMT